MHEVTRLWDVTQPESLQTFQQGDAVWKAEFSGDESGLLTRSGDWLHQLPLGESAVRNSRRVVGWILNEPRWITEKRRFSVARRWPGGGAISIQSLSWDDYDEPPIEGEPVVLFKDWQDKLVAVHGVGRSEGKGSWRRALVMASVTNSSTLRPCWRQVSRIVCMVSTKRLPPAL